MTSEIRSLVGKLDLQCLIDKLYSKIMTTVQENGRYLDALTVYIAEASDIRFKKNCSKGIP